MSVTGFLSSMADKAQNALGNSPIAQHIPPSLTGAPRPSPGASSAPADSHKSHALGQIQHQFRQLQQNYSTTTPVQKIITAEKGVALDFESISRDSRYQSKELYEWGQKEHSDVKDVSDRLAFLNYISGQLAATLSAKLNAARAPLKELRSNEVALFQKRNVRNGLEYQISRAENSKEKGHEKRAAELRGQLAKAEIDDEPLEKQHEILLRKALKESEQQKFQALREYGEKLSLLAQAAESVLAVFPSLPPSTTQPYTGGEETGSVRASLQYALDHWKPGQTTLSAPADAILDRSNTGSFGETHAQELQQIDTTSVPAQAPGAAPASPPASFSSPPAGASTSPGINPAVLNTEPTPIPTGSPPGAVTVSGPVGTDVKVPVVTPTVAETGVPVSGGPGGPGPSSGSLYDIHPSSPDSSQAVSHIAKTPATEEGISSTPAKQYESAEEEKRRLEREERERLLRGDAQSSEASVPGSGAPSKEDEGGDTPPPYQDI